MGSQSKSVPDGVSRRMLIVIIAMLAIILLPAAVVSVPFSKVVVTITNTDSEYTVTGYLSVYDGIFTGYLSAYGALYGSGNEILLMPGEHRVLSYTLKAGTYDVYIYYTFQNEPQYYGRSFIRSVSVSMFETEEVQIDLARY